MAKYTIELLKKEMVAEGTEAFYFSKPKGFKFLAGQHAEYTLIDPKETDAEGNMRIFSYIVSPEEDRLGIATRMRDTAFKRNLGKMETGDKIEMAGPFGNFLLHEKAERPAIFLVGGIGITPFMSIIKDADYKEKNGIKLPHRYLFFSNRRPKDAPFFEGLTRMAEDNKNLTLIPTMSDIGSEGDWSGEQGYIHMQMIEKYVPNRGAAIYYMAGPEKMVQAMREMLNKEGVSNDDIKTEEFSGY